MKVYFTYVRHGETLFNEIRRMQGMCDSPLTAEGIAQAENTASVLRHEHFDHIFCSSSERAWDTAKILAQYHHAEPVTMKGLKEFDFGDLDGEMIPEKEHIIQPHRISDDWTDVGGDNCETFKARAEKAFNEILSKCKDQDHVLLVSHGSFLTHFMKTMCDGYDQKEFIERKKRQGLPFVPNCSVSKFSFEDGTFTFEQEPMTAEECRAKENKTVTFYFVRHGETVFNIQKRMQGHCDSPLTEKGIRQAEERRETFQNVPFDAAYASTTERTRDTASILLKGKDTPAVYDKRLREVFFGRFEGEHYEPHWNELMRMHMNTDYSSVGGETKKEVQRRLASLLHEMIDTSKDGSNILLVSHGELYMCLMELLFDLNHQDIYNRAGKNNPTPNLGYAVFRYTKGAWKLLKLMSEDDKKL